MYDMTQHVKHIFLYIFLVAAAASYAAVRAVDDFNYLLNFTPLKTMLVQYFQNRMKTEVSVGELSVAIFQHPGISFSKVMIGPPKGYHVSAENVTLILSPVQRFREGDWLKRIRLDHLRLELLMDLLTGKTSLPGKAPMPEFSLPEIELHHPDITIRQGKTSITLEGPMTGYARVRSNGGITVTGEINFNGMRLRYNDDIIRLKGAVIMKGHDIFSPGLDFISDLFTVSASGTYTVAARRLFYGRVHIKGLGVGGGRGGGSPILDAILAQLNGGADFSISDMTLFGIPIEKVTARAVARNGALILNDLEAQGTYMNGSGTVIVSPGMNTSFNVAFVLKNYDMRHVLETVFPGRKSWVDGTMSIEGRVWGNSGAICGDLLFSSFGGRLLKFQTMSKLFGAFNFYKLIANRNPDLMTKGFPYNSVLSKLTIKDSVITFENFYLDSNSIQLSANGTYEMKTDKIDALLGIRPLETVDRAVGLIPVIGWLIEGSDKGMLIVYCKMSGSFDNLKVVPAPMVTLAKGLSGTILRTLMLPYTIFTKPQKLIPGLGDK